MARKEAELILTGTRFMNQALEGYVPGRSLEAIKGQRRKEDYKILVRRMVTDLENTPGPAPKDMVPAPAKRPEAPPGTSSESEDEETATGSFPPSPQQTSPGDVATGDLVARRGPDPDPDPGRVPVSVPGSRLAAGNLKQKKKEGLHASFSQRIRKELEKIPDEYGEEFHPDRLHQIAEDVQRGVPREEVLQKITLYLLQIFPTMERVNKPETEREPRARISKRKERRNEYYTTQKLWKKNPGRYLRALLKDVKAEQYPAPNHMFPFWEEMLTAVNEDTPGQNDAIEAKDELWRPIWATEIKNAFPSVGTAPGPDGLTVQNLRKLPLTILQKIFLVFQYCERVPTYLLRSYTTMIPKKSGIVEPKDFRPITVSSVLIRTYHKVLANRLQATIEIDHRQRAFRDFDGVAGSTFLLDTIIRHQRQTFKPLFMAFIDVAKAFDTVTHRTIKDTLYSKGVPGPLVAHIEDVYNRSKTELWMNRIKSHEIHPNRGVKQGDPLSPLIFNYVIDGMLQTLSDHIGVKIGGKTINALAFADDLILIATTPSGLQTILDQATTYLLKCGLAVNTGKSMSMAIRTVPKEKKTVVDGNTTFLCAGRRLKALTRDDEWRYLGVPFTPMGYTTANTITLLQQMILVLNRAPLKPQQRLFALRITVLPSIYHSLVLGRTTLSLLKKTDKLVRATVRRWVALPHDVPNAYIHASGVDGGLGIPSVRWEVPIRRWGRLQAIVQRSDVEENTTMLTFLRREISNTETRLDDPVLRIRSRKDMKRRWAELLYASVDGKALKGSAKVPQQHQWVTEGTKFLHGKDFINMCKLRINALPVRARTTRGRAHDRACRGGCTHSETLHHILQQCHRTHDARIKRHDAIVQYLCNNLKQKSYQIETEPQIRTNEGLRKPDILAIKGRSAYVIDAQVVSEQSDLDRRHKEKVKYYAENKSLIKNIKDTYEAVDVAFSSATVSARGLWSSRAAQDLKIKGFIKATDLKIISTRVILGGIIAFRTFTERTDIHGRRGRTGVG